MAETLAGILCQKLRHHLGVGLGGEGRAPGGQLFTQFREVFDDAVMDDGDAVDEMRMGIGFVGNTVRRPAGVSDADHARQRLFRKSLLQVEELSFRPATVHRAIVDGGYTRRIVTAIFETLQRIDKPFSNGLGSDNSDNSAHIFLHRRSLRRNY